MNVESGVNLEQVSRVKEGWLLKRGEHIKNWRQRYFILYENGYLMGFREKPQTSSDFSNPLNTYNLKNCQIMKSDSPKRNVFIVRGQFGKTVVERLFGAENAAKREEWCNSIQFVAEKMKFEEAMRTSSFDKPGAPHAPIVHDSHKRKRRFSIGTVENARDGRRKITLDDFEFIKVLGKGTFGKVILCREKQTHALYAIKILKKEMVIGKNEIEHTLTENRVLQSCKHPFITQLKYSFQTNDRLCLVMEYVNGGELFFHLSRSPGKVFPENKARFYSAEITSALGYLHEHGIVYRDLKLENLLLDKDGHIKIADFGLSKEHVSAAEECKT
ncbi:hypothetical protein RvY_08096-2 [Ramazzottius varieornatus]|nr:hypothetical protein RvY_08096-2 [Ramazzottius varieornatus]